MKSQQQFDKTFSLELFPPRTEQGFEKLTATIAELSTLKPLYFSVTYGAGGSTQERTFQTIDWLREQGIETAPHISCIGSDKSEIDTILQRYQQQDISRLVALRGDLPSGAGLGELDELRYANELVEHIRETTGDHFHIEVAAYPEYHPQATNPATDLENFKRKVDAGANAAITQYFYNADSYLFFVDACEKSGLDIPIVPGIMPITNYTQLARFSDGCGAEIPRWIRKRLEAYGDDLESLRAFGEEVVTSMCQRLLDEGAPGLHFYSMNQVAPTMRLWKNLNIS
ncbi:MAG: methylenetetrahydrofolate reductase [NAD(P)H] [Gammaproteobacteria bacterium]|nr:methylenetetrahydrofolate reductase [NAD(P)H] [Gammaproteobacteria bacterium]